MASKVDPLVLKKTMEIMGRVIKKPALTEKLLGRPPFRYLHDIIMEVSRTSGFFEGLYNSQEKDARSIQEKEAKCQFLQKAVNVLSFATGELVKTRPSKVVAGQDVERTNEFLQLLANAVLNKVDSKDAVRRVLKGEDPAQKLAKSKEKQEEKKPEEKKAEEKERKKRSEKAKPSEGDEGSTSKQRSSHREERPGESRKRSSGTEVSKTGKSKEHSKEDPSKTSRSSLHSKSQTKVTAQEEGEGPPPSRPSHKPSRKRGSVEQEQPSVATGGGASGGSDGVEDEGLGGSDTRVDRPPSARGVRKGGRGGRGTRPSIDSSGTVEESIRSITHGAASSEGGGTEVGGEAQMTAPPRSPSPPPTLQGGHAPMALPPSKRPGSARPAPPRIVHTSKPEDATANAPAIAGETALPPNVIMDTAAGGGDQDSDDDDQFIVEDSAPIVPPPEEAFGKAASEDALADEKPEGALTKNIVAMKEHLEGGMIKKEGSDHEQTLLPGISEAHRKKEREMVSREIEKLQSSIQTLCKSANPLGKIMDYVQEDIDSMQKELELWQAENKKHADSLQREQSITELELQPLRAQLEELEAKIVEQVDMISATKANILKNDLKSKQMLNSMTFATS